MLNIKTFYFNPFEECTILLWDESGAGVIVDPGCHHPVELKEVTDYLERKEIKPVAIWLTHAHLDHIFGVSDLMDLLHIPVFMHPAEAETLAYVKKTSERLGMSKPRTDFRTTPIHEGDKLTFGSVTFSVIETPGHTPGGVCFLDEADRVLVSGDTLFKGTIGRTDLEGGDYDSLIQSVMNKLMGLDGDIEVIPGHGGITDIAYERTHNPFLQPFNEPEEDWDAPETPYT